MLNCHIFNVIIVHRIGRTGRSGRTGVATTFINMNCSEQILLDLKHLLREAKQRVPPVLEALEDPLEKFKDLTGGAYFILITDIRNFNTCMLFDTFSNTAVIFIGCTFCGGLGHRITACPKLDAQRKQQLGSLSRGGGGIGGGDY